MNTHPVYDTSREDAFRRSRICHCHPQATRTAACLAAFRQDSNTIADVRDCPEPLFSASA